MKLGRRLGRKLGRPLGVALAKFRRFASNVAALSLNFLTGTLDARITFTRASTATYINSSGTITSAAIDAARFDYNPSTLAPRGLLIEEQRTNLLLQSEALDNASWSSVGTIVVTADTSVAPSGATVADTLSFNTASAYRYQGATVTNTPASVSVFLKSGTRTTCTLTFGDAGFTNAGKVTADLTAGTVGGATVSGTATGASATIVNVGNGWYRVTLTVTVPAGSGYFGIGNDAATGTIIAWGAQIEQGAFATSYIPTTTAAVTRSADVASMTGTNFSSWFNASAGTFAIAADCPASGTRPVIEADDNTTANLISLYGSATTAKFDVTTASVSQASISAGTISAAAFKLAAAYTVNDFAASLNAAAVVTDALGTVPTVTQLLIGADKAGNALNGHVQSITYFNTRKTNAELQALST